MRQKPSARRLCESTVTRKVERIRCTVDAGSRRTPSRSASNKKSSKLTYLMDGYEDELSRIFSSGGRAASTRGKTLSRKQQDPPLTRHRFRDTSKQSVVGSNPTCPAKGSSSVGRASAFGRKGRLRVATSRHLFADTRQVCISNDL